MTYLFYNCSMRPIHANLEELTLHLAQQQNWQQLAEIFNTFEVKHPIENLEDWRVIARALQHIPQTILLQFDPLIAWYASTLIALRDEKTILASTSAHPAMLAARAWLHLHHQQFYEAEKLLRVILPKLTGKLFILCLKNLGQVNFVLGEAWQPPFQQAKVISQGRDYGLCLLDEGVCYARSGDSPTARELWLEALPLFKSDPYHLAWLRYNLGISCAKDLLPDAERHFFQLQRLAKKPDLSVWQSRAWCGFGITHRVRGEWERAIYAYTHALKTALEPDDHLEAASCLALTLRLASRIQEALEVLLSALMQAPFGAARDTLLVQRAACYLVLQDPNRAKATLDALVSPTAADQIRVAFLKAELYRRQQNLTLALELLRQQPNTQLATREEAMYWQGLRAMYAVGNLVPPESLVYSSNFNVSVYALGGVRVLVNARAAELEPRCADLLLFLLEQGQYAPIAVVAQALFPMSQPNTAQSNVRHLITGLRDSFCWAESIVLDNNILRLDTAAYWFYDKAQARDSSQPIPEVTADFIRRAN